MGWGGAKVLKLKRGEGSRLVGANVYNKMNRHAIQLNRRSWKCCEAVHWGDRVNRKDPKKEGRRQKRKDATAKKLMKKGERGKGKKEASSRGRNMENPRLHQKTDSTPTKQRRNHSAGLTFKRSVKL